MDLVAGTSGDACAEWKGSFYPEGLAAWEMLAGYAWRLPAVEIDHSFYRLPGAGVLEGRAAPVPERERRSS
jgi:uncharacterized protein YecE (DUF72 family)